MDYEYRVAVFICFWALGSPSVGLEDHLNADENKGWRLHSFCPREIGTVHSTARVEYTVVWERPKDPPQPTAALDADSDNDDDAAAAATYRAEAQLGRDIPLEWS